MEITATEPNIDKRMKKKNEDSLRVLCDNIKHINICIIEKRENTWENIWRGNNLKLPQHGKRNNKPSHVSAESPRQDKPKEAHTKAHSNQTDKLKTKIKYWKQQGKNDK